MWSKAAALAAAASRSRSCRATAERAAIPQGPSRRRADRRRQLLDRGCPRPPGRGRGGDGAGRRQARHVGRRRRRRARAIIPFAWRRWSARRGRVLAEDIVPETRDRAQRPGPAREARQCRGEARHARQSDASARSRSTACSWSTCIMRCSRPTPSCGTCANGLKPDGLDRRGRFRTGRSSATESRRRSSNASSPRSAMTRSSSEVLTGGEAYFIAFRIAGAAARARGDQGLQRLEPAGPPEAVVEPEADRDDDSEDDEIAVSLVRAPACSGNSCRRFRRSRSARRESRPRRPSWRVIVPTRCCSSRVLSWKTEVERVAQAVDARLDAPDMILDVAEIGPRLRLDARQLLPRRASARPRPSARGSAGAG